MLGAGCRAGFGVSGLATVPTPSIAEVKSTPGSCW